MIEFRNLTKVFHLRGQRKVVADNINVVFPTGKAVGLLGRNGAGKSTLLKMIAGTMDATEGQIISGSFHGELTGAQNARFIARIYGVDTDELVDFVRDFAGLGGHFDLPFRTYSAGMKSRLAFGVSMAVPFDTYLVDEVTSVGDASFRAKSAEVFNARMEHAGAVVVSHGMGQIKQLCDAGAVLNEGVLTYYEDVEEAIAVHQQNMKSI